MFHNMGWHDRAFHVVGGLAILIAGLIFGSWSGIVGLIPLISAAAGQSAIYSLLKTNTCVKDEC
jgi:hypothetical protein